MSGIWQSWKETRIMSGDFEEETGWDYKKRSKINVQKI